MMLFYARRYSDAERKAQDAVVLDSRLPSSYVARGRALSALGRYGEVRLAAGGRLYTPTAVTTPGAEANALEDANVRRSFVLDDGNSKHECAGPQAISFVPVPPRAWGGMGLLILARR